MKEVLKSVRGGSGGGCLGGGGRGEVGMGGGRLMVLVCFGIWGG